MSLALRYNLGEVPGLAARVARLAGRDTRSLMDALGAEAESQTRRRIKDEKRSPEGERWRPWSPAYAETRHGGHSLLMAWGHLHDSVQYIVGTGGEFMEWGSNLVYARPHQFGTDFSILSTRRHVEIPARPWLGLSGENLADLGAVVDDWADRQLEAL